MEVRLEALEGQSVPQDTYLSLRIGTIQKQSRFAPNRTFHFPEPKDGNKADFGRIEVYKKIGACNVPLAGLDEYPRDIQITCGDTVLPRLGLRIEIGPEGVAAAQDRLKDKAKRKKDKLDEAQKYIADHNLEELLAQSLRDVMRKQPGDPATFLSGQIMEKKMKPMLPPLAGEKSEKKCAKAKNVNRSASEPRKGPPPPPDRKVKAGEKPRPPDEVASPTKSRPAAPQKMSNLSPPPDEPPAAIPPKALSRAASWSGSGFGPLSQDSPKAAPQAPEPEPQPLEPRIEPRSPDFRSAPADLWDKLHAPFRSARIPQESSASSSFVPGVRQAAPALKPVQEVASPAAADVLEAEPKLSAQVGGLLSQTSPLGSGHGQSAAQRFGHSPLGGSMMSTSSTSSIALARSFPLPQQPGHAATMPMQMQKRGSSPQSMRSTMPVRTSAGQVDPGYIQDLRGAINAKEAKLRALAAQLQELSRLQQTTQLQQTRQ